MLVMEWGDAVLGDSGRKSRWAGCLGRDQNDDDSQAFKIEPGAPAPMNARRHGPWDGARHPVQMLRAPWRSLGRVLGYGTRNDLPDFVSLGRGQPVSNRLSRIYRAARCMPLSPLNCSSNGPRRRRRPLSSKHARAAAQDAVERAHVPRVPPSSREEHPGREQKPTAASTIEPNLSSSSSTCHSSTEHNGHHVS